MERWILHKLNVAATEVNQLLNDRSFLQATNAVYNFWLYELCDVFIVSSNPQAPMLSYSELLRRLGSDEAHDG